MRSFIQGLLLVAAGLFVSAGVADAAPSTDVEKAKKLNGDARRFDARAESHRLNAQRQRDRSDDLREKVAELRARASQAESAEAAQLRSRADDLDVQATIADADATQAASQSQRALAIAKKLRARAKQAAQTPRNKKRTATIGVSSTELCELTVDGVSEGYTPFQSLALEPGRHALVCTGVDGRSVKHAVRVREGATTSLTLSFPPKPRDPAAGF